MNHHSIDKWDISQVINIKNMFYNAISFKSVKPNFRGISYNLNKN